MTYHIINGVPTKKFGGVYNLRDKILGSYITVGFVYGKIPLSKAEDELITIFNFLLSNQGECAKYQYCRDSAGDNWVKRVADDFFLENIGLLIYNYFGEMKIRCNLFNKEQIDVYIKLSRPGDDRFGILLDIPEIQLINPPTSEGLIKATHAVMGFIRKIYKVSSFSYAFCDYDAMIEYSPTNFMAQKKDIYSVVALPDENFKDHLHFTMSSWNIDGHTLRDF